jgi:chromosome partitioning protein
MTRIVAIANQKGGVGKTTTAVNLGACLGALGVKSLIIDFDPQCNTTSGLGMREPGAQKNIYLAFVQGKSLVPHIVETNYTNLWLVPSTPDLSGAEVELQEDGDKYYALKKMLETAIGNYDIVLIDCPPSLSLLTVNALAAAHSILIPIQCEYYGLEGLSQLTKTIDLIQKKLNRSLEIEGILLTMCDMRTNLAQQVASEVRKYFGSKVYSSFIPRNVRLSEAPGFGKPIINYDPASTGARSYMEFAKEFISRHPELAALALKQSSGEQFTHSV